MKRYNPKDIETKWQKVWQEDKIYQAIDFAEKKKFVMLTEFPYPSGSGIHIGHTREYTIGDILARYKRMNGYNVLFPMGFDAFGLPTENYAIKNKVSPIKATDDNVAIFETQLKSLGLSIDWQRTFKTSDPSYYKWTQWLFLRFFKAGLVYQDETFINWCPFCKTGLANEEVINGRHERCDTLVEKKLLKQWIMRITDYADRLIEGLKTVDYPSKIADQQINWIGRSNGAQIKFNVSGSDKIIEVFSTRIDTIYSAACLILAPEHPMIKDIVNPKHKQTVNDYINSVKLKSEIDRQNIDKDRTGVFSGAYAINPINSKLIPIWIADFVLVNYGTGAVFGDIHDERDATFLKTHNIDATVSVVPKDQQLRDKVVSMTDIYTEDGYLINSERFDGLTSAKAREEILEYLVSKGQAQKKVNYRLRDWIFSRQHYWGEPIPIIHCPEHGAVAVPDEDLPVELPPVDKYEPTDNGQSPLSLIDSFVNTKCPICQQPAKRETDTMPNWAGSSWYYLRYFDAHNDLSFADKDKLDYWQNVDLYLGGMEHTTLHLLYSRFWHQFLYDQKMVPTPEPYQARRGQGIILGPDGLKMSKSKGNVVNPSDIIESGYGADSLRLAIAFIAPYDLTTPWNPEILGGTYRYLNRVWVLVDQIILRDSNQSVSEQEDKNIKQIMANLINKVGNDIELMNFNTAIAALMETLNGFYKIFNDVAINFNKDIWLDAISQYIKLLAIFAPHISEEIWRQKLNNKDSVHLSTWPVFNKNLLSTDNITIIAQVNGKMRATFILPTGTGQEEITKLVLNDQRVAKFIDQKSIKKTIFVKDKIINFVV